MLPKPPCNLVACKLSGYQKSELKWNTNELKTPLILNQVSLCLHHIIHRLRLPRLLLSLFFTIHRRSSSMLRAFTVVSHVDLLLLIIRMAIHTPTSISSKSVLLPIMSFKIAQEVR